MLHRLRSLWRAATRRASFEADMEDDIASTEPEAERALLMATVAAAAAKLSPGARTVFLLHDVEGYTHEEIGRMLDIAPGTSKAQLHHARRALRVLLGNGQLFRNSIGGAGGGIDDVLHPLVEHGVQQIQSVHNVIAEIFARLPYRLSNISGRGKVDHGLDVVLLDGGFIGQVGFHQDP